MEREQMRLPINQMNIDVDCNKYKQTFAKCIELYMKKWLQTPR